MAWRYSANIPTYITGKDDNGEPVVLYRVNVFLQQHNQDGSDAASAQSPGTDAAAPFFVLRRYSQFRHLHDQLKSAFPAVMSGKGMAPPPKHPLVLGALGFGGGGGVGGAEARQREMLERRRAELERWIWRLIGSPEIAGSPQFKSFLEFDRALARAQQQQRRKLEAQRSSFSPGSTAGGPAGSGPPSEAGFGHTGGYPAGGGLDDSASDASGPSMAGGVSLGGASTSTSTVVPAAVLGAALGGPAGADGGLRDGDGGRQHPRGSAPDAAAGTRGSPAGRAPPGSNATSSVHPHAPDAPHAVQHQRLSHPSLASSSPHPVAGSGAAAAGGAGGGGAVFVTGAVGMGSMAGLPMQAAAAAAAGGAGAPATAATPGLLRLGIHLHSRSDVRRLVEVLVARLETACTDAATASEEAVLLRDANRAMAERLGELESEVAGGGAAAQVRAVLVEAEAARAAAEQRAAQLADSLTSRTTAHEHQVAALQAQLAEARAENAEMLKRLADWGVGGPPPASVAAGGGGSSGPASGGGAAVGDGGAEAAALRQRMEELQAELGRREGETAERAAEAEALQARVRQLDEQLAAEAKRREQAEAAAKAAAAAAATPPPPPPPPPPAAPQNNAALDRARADNALLAQEVQRLRGVLAAEREAHKAAAAAQAQTAAALQARVKELERAMAASGLGAGAGPAAGFGNGDSLI